MSLFLSTLSLRRATRDTVDCYMEFIISIHALLAESDVYVNYNMYNNTISIHALLAESDVSFMLYDTSSLIFLSTLSLRRATALGLPGWLRVLISIHALLAESDRVYVNYNMYNNTISIHALLAESDEQ